MPASAFIDPCPLEYQDKIAQYYIDYTQCGGDGVPACAKILDDANRYNCELAAKGYCYSCDPAKCSKYNIPCSQSGTKVPPPDEGDSTWIVVIGAIGALGIGAVAGVKILGKNKPPQGPPSSPKPVPQPRPKEPAKKEEKKEEKKPTVYSLYISTGHLKVAPDTPGTLVITAMKKVGDSPPVPATEAELTVSVPAQCKGVYVVPASGTGQMQCTISVDQSVNVGEVLLTVTGSAMGTMTSAQVTVEIDKEYKIVFT